MRTQFIPPVFRTVSEGAWTEKSESPLSNGLREGMVPEEGVEPSRPGGREILSRSCK
jgi:hypothetical protein